MPGMPGRSFYEQKAFRDSRRDRRGELEGIDSEKRRRDVPFDFLFERDFPGRYRVGPVHADGGPYRDESGGGAQARAVGFRRLVMRAVLQPGAGSRRLPREDGQGACHLLP